MLILNTKNIHKNTNNTKNMQRDTNAKTYT